MVCIFHPDLVVTYSKLKYTSNTLYFTMSYINSLFHTNKLNLVAEAPNVYPTQTKEVQIAMLPSVNLGNHSEASTNINHLP